MRTLVFLYQYTGKIAGNIFIFIFSTDDHRNRVFAGLLSFFLPVKSNPAIKETIIKDLYECCKAKKVENEFPQVISQYYPIHKQKWFGGYNKVRCENNPQSPISCKNDLQNWKLLVAGHGLRLL